MCVRTAALESKTDEEVGVEVIIERRMERRVAYGERSEDIRSKSAADRRSRGNSRGRKRGTDRQDEKNLRGCRTQRAN